MTTYHVIMMSGVAQECSLCEDYIPPRKVYLKVVKDDGEEIIICEKCMREIKSVWEYGEMLMGKEKETTKRIEEYIRKEIHDTAIAFYNSMTDYLGEPTEDDLDKIKEQLHRLHTKVHEDEDLELRDAWAEASGQAELLLEISKEMNIDLTDEEKIIFEGINGLFP